MSDNEERRGGQGQRQPDPSQAEGERRPGSDAGAGSQDTKHTPSQAEGDRETVERDIKQKEEEGYFDKDKG